MERNEKPDPSVMKSRVLSCSDHTMRSRLALGAHERYMAACYRSLDAEPAAGFHTEGTASRMRMRALAWIAGVGNERVSNLETEGDNIRIRMVRVESIVVVISHPLFLKVRIQFCFDRSRCARHCAVSYC